MDHELQFALITGKKWQKVHSTFYVWFASGSSVTNVVLSIGRCNRKTKAMHDSE